MCLDGGFTSIDYCNWYKSDNDTSNGAKILKQSASPIISRGGAIRFKNEGLFNQHLSATDDLAIYNKIVNMQTGPIAVS